MLPIVSVIVPIYNVHQYLNRCINSIVNQTYTKLDIVLVDDGSTDGSAELCDKFAMEDSRIQVIHKKNGGLVSARKAGLSISTGNYVMPVDGDDWIDPETIERMLYISRKYNCPIVQCGCMTERGNESNIRGDVIPSGLYDLTEFSEEFFAKLFMDPQNPSQRGIRSNLWSCLFRREAIYPFQMQVPDDIVNGEDDACFYPAVLSASSFYKLENPMYHFTIRPTSLSHQEKYFNVSEVCILERIIRPFIEAHHSGKFILNQFHEYLCSRFLWHAKMAWGYSLTYTRNYIFPFKSLPENCKIVLYGAGKVGKSYMSQMDDMDNIHLVAWVDQNCNRMIYGNTIYNPNEINKFAYDYIILAVLSKDIAREICQTLEQNGVSHSRILWEKPEISRKTFFHDV